jgi:hypothetical protein
MAIRRQRDRRPSFFEELPPAKLYLDDIQDLVTILTVSGGETPSEFSVQFSLGEVACDGIEDLQQIGGRTTKFKIAVTETKGELGVPSNARQLQSWLEISSMAT